MEIIKNTPKSFYSDFGVFFILLQFIVEMYLKHIEKNVVICKNKLLKEMEGEHEKSFIYFNRSDLGNGIFGVRDEKHGTDWYG